MNLPVGYFNFHKDAFINYQLNRWYSLGYTRKTDIEHVGSRTKTFADYVAAFTQLAEESVAQNRLKNAAFYYRAAEFLVEPYDKNKLPLYDQFRDCFYRAFAEDPIERHEVVYAGSYLPAMRLPANPTSDRKKGTILACGGFDSFIEEFYCMWAYFAAAGYDVIAFEGPGQGAALRKYGLPFDHDWEKPTGAVLDHFGVLDATLIGVSMGGYWAIRAAAFEKRIKRVISFPPVYDWMELAGGFNRGLVYELIKWRSLMNFLVRLKMSSGRLKHTINHALFITQKQEPIDAVHWMLGMNKDHLHSDLVDQDVLLLCGENDAFQPPKLLYKQQQALTHAQSITTRIFTKAEHADQHCQIGNIGLALDVMLEWLNET
ncbi:MAG: alpha/beta fold hydrolase [Anaerolineales bacterium]|nr:alpha/beta fold hydrolase [Anaerolineales bacterium]